MNVLAPGLSCLSLLATLSPASAQDPSLPFARPEVRGSEPVERIVYLTYDVQSERIRTVREASPNDLALGNPLCFDNSEPSLPLTMAYVVAGPGQDLLNWGRKFCRGAGLLRSITIGYRTEAVSVEAGGPGAAFSVALHSGTAGFGQPGTELFRRTFTGLPAAAQGQVLFLLTIDFSTDPLPLPDGAFGWSYLQIDGDTGPLLVRAPKALLGTLDALDVYGPGPAHTTNYLGTFNYGGCQTSGAPCANTWMQLDEIANGELALTAELNGTGVNPSLLHEILPARLGHTFVAAVDVNPPVGVEAVTVLLSSLSFSAPATTRYGEVLIDVTQEVFPPLFGEGAYSFPIPADRALVGRRVFLQAAVLPPTVARMTLTNALRVRIGY